MKEEYKILFYLIPGIIASYLFTKFFVLPRMGFYVIFSFADICVLFMLVIIVYGVTMFVSHTLD